jgi:hypothetical protein
VPWVEFQLNLQADGSLCKVIEEVANLEVIDAVLFRDFAVFNS